MQLDSISTRIVRDMNEGVLVISKDGKIILANARAQVILEKKKSELEGKPFVKPFFNGRINDEFNQTILDAIYENEKVHENVVTYHVDDRCKHVKVITSCLRSEEGKSEGVIVVLTDITELVEVKEHLKMMNQIEKLNKTLEKQNKFIRKAFSKYLSEEIVEQILDKPDGLSIGGKSENLTVLMSDLRGFTALCEQMPPDGLMDMLNHYFDIMSRIIRALNGTIIEYAGDGILAIFGAPIRSDNHALCAVVAGLQMQESMADINEWNSTRGYPELNMGIGINTGEAVVGNMGSEYAMKYNIIGGCVNLCGRIESYTIGGKIFVSPYTIDMIDSELLIDEQLEIKPKGVNIPIKISSVYGIKEPYNIVLTKNIGRLCECDTPIDVSIFALDGKHVADEGKPGKVVAVSKKSLRITADAVFEKYDNLLIKSDVESYCKVIEASEDGYVVALTGGYWDWISRCK
ncbi:MAG: PAS domain-containing protein [Lachnospiraceae bacterium]|nr:PAS domain-containing protein [Candidatus Colinaster equi]